jgi:hypothetical protein
MSSPFLYLNQRKLALPRDTEHYNEVTNNTNKKVAWKFFSAGCLSKLYDLSSLPKPTNKLALYTTFIVMTTALTIYRESTSQIQLLTDLDSKYKPQYEDYVKSSGFESIS